MGLCGSFVPMTGYAQRNEWKPRCGACAVAPKGAHDPHVEWLVATMKHGVKAQPVPGETYNDLGRETVWTYKALPVVALF